MSDESLNQKSSKRKSRRSIFPAGIAIPFYPALAQVLGTQDALLLTQIDYWLHNMRLSRDLQVHDGERWLNWSAAKIHDKGYRHTTPRTINRTLLRLEGKGCIKIAEEGQRQWVTINYSGLDALNIPCDPVPCRTDDRDKVSQDRDKTSRFEDEPRQNVSETETKRPGTPIYKSLDKDSPIPNERGEESRPVGQGAGLVPQKEPRTPEPNKTEMAQALANACVLNLDLEWIRNEVEAYADKLIAAGYNADQVSGHAAWWYEFDWRGKKGEAPRLREIAATLEQSIQHQYTSVLVTNIVTPDDAQARELAAIAEPNCAFCDGKGWCSDFDPRTGWWVCDCVPDDE